jgi:multidrug resistance efflux pump
VNDFEILRQVLEFYEGEYKGSADAAIDRIEAEVEGAKEHHELHHAEVERLRAELEDARLYTQAEIDAMQEGEVKILARLLANLPGPEHSVAAFAAEVERLRDEHHCPWRDNYDDAQAEVEGLRVRTDALQVELDNAPIWAEVERLRADNEQHLKQWTQDVERLRVELAQCDEHQGYGEGKES